MGEFSGGFRTAGAGSTTLPIASLYAVAGTTFSLREVAVFNTTAVAVVLALRFLTSTGTQGTGRDELNRNAGVGGTPQCTLFDTHTGGPTITAGNLALFPLGGVIGSGVIRTFKGIVVPKGTTNGVGLVVLTGTGQICDVDWDWDEI